MSTSARETILTWDSPYPSRGAGSARTVIQSWLGAGATALASAGMSCDQSG